MARNFKELQAKMDPERCARVEQRVTEALKPMPLEGPTDGRELTQEKLAWEPNDSISRRKDIQT
jgi:hypothetical protein